MGEFNSPFGNYKNPNIVNEITLKAVSKYFNEADITFLNGDFASTVKGIKKGAFVYFDPPYAPISKTSNFTGYNESGFGEVEQIRLKELCDSLHSKGVNFMVSNSNCEFIRELYKEQRDTMIKAMKKYFPADVTFTRPAGGMFIWVTLPGGESSKDLFSEAIRKKVAFVPGDPFYTDGRIANTMRLNYTNASKEMIEEGIRRIGDILLTKKI